jgi:uncharacterized protein YggE
MHVLLFSILITVSAQGRASAPPDMATESFTISTNSDTAAAAASDNNARYERLMRALQSMGVAHGDIQTTSYNLSYTPPPQAQSGQGEPPGQAPPGVPQQRYGYFVNRSIQVTLTRLQMVGKVVDAAVGSGVTDIGGVSFGVRNNRAQYAQALREAVAAARAQGDAMASAAGLHLVRVKSMQQGYAEAPVPRVMMAASMQGAVPSPPTAIEPSNVEVNANVTITYEAR